MVPFDAGAPRRRLGSGFRWPGETAVSPRDELARKAGRPRVLLAEDDAAFRGLIARVLLSAGYDVVEARDGAELLERVAEASLPAELTPRPFSVIVTDVRMPGISGLDALAFLRATAWRRAPVIVMTAFGDALACEAAHRLGAAMVLDKPFEVEHLRSVVERTIVTAMH